MSENYAAVNGGGNETPQDVESAWPIGFDARSMLVLLLSAAALLAFVWIVREAIASTLDERLDRQDERFDQIDRELDRIHRRLDSQNTHLDRIDSTSSRGFRQTNGQMDRTDARIDRLEVKVDRIEALLIEYRLRRELEGD